MTDEAYKDAQDKADELGLSFSSYIGMLAKKESSSDFYGDATPLRPVGLMSIGRVNPAAEKQALTRSISKWALGKGFKTDNEEIVSKIVNKILEETR